MVFVYVCTVCVEVAPYLFRRDSLLPLLYNVFALRMNVENDDKFYIQILFYFAKFLCNIRNSTANDKHHFVLMLLLLLTLVYVERSLKKA